MENFNSAFQQSFADSKSASRFNPLYLLSIIIALSLVIFVYKKMDNGSTGYILSDTKASIRANIRSYVTAGNSAYTYSKLGGIYGLKITVANSTDYLLENVRVKLIHIKANGGVWKEQFINFNLVSANSQMMLPVPDEERGVKISYEIVSIRSSSLGLY